MALFSDGENSKTIKIYFVQDGATCSKEMKNAYSICQDAKFHPKIISEDSIEELNELESNVVYVLETFCGEAFEFLSDKNCLVVGPQCIITCISEKIPIPNNGSPVYNVALRGIVISSTNLSKKDKNEIKKLSGYMGAVYSEDLTLAVTHLVADNIISIVSGKCGKAIENNIMIVWPMWIKKSWELCQEGSKAPDAFNFKVKPFQGMHISCSNLTMHEKKKLQKLIESNGGVYQRTLEMKKTVVLVVGDPEGKKWQYAQQWGVPCVSPTWVCESVERGFPVPSKNHLVSARPRCSTPTHSNDNDSFMSTDLSVVPMSSDRSNVDETNTSLASEISVRSTRFESKNREPPPSVDDEYKKLLEELSMSEIRNAGLFLDGCKIFLSGFTPLEVEKLKKVINAGGATLFPSISDCLSHVVVGEFSASDAKELSTLNPRPTVVKLKWLIQCLKEKTTVGVEPYLCLQSTSAPPASPLSHKGLKLLKSQNGLDGVCTTPENESRTQVSRKLFVKSSFVKPGVESSNAQANPVDVSALEKRALEEMNKEKEEKTMSEKEPDLTKQSFEGSRQEAKEVQRDQEQRGSDQTKDTTVNEDEEESQIQPFLEGLWFEILGYKDGVQESVELAGGKIVSQPSDPIPDYAIVPVEGTDAKISAKKVVTIIFLEDCFDQERLITDLEYYHHPIPGLLDSKKNLEGEVVAMTKFSRAERRLLEYVGTNLGAIVQGPLSRNAYPEKGIHKSTILLCKEKAGKMHDAAVKWGIRVELPSWLMSLVEPEIPLSSNSTHSVQGGENSTPMDVEDPTVNSPTDTFIAEPPPHLKKLPAVESIIGPPQMCSPSRKRLMNLEGSPTEPPKPKRHSTPISVIKKQIWASTGWVNIEGIQPNTGKLMKDGPYGEWAKDGSSAEKSLTGPPQDCGGSSENTPSRKRYKTFVKACENLDNDDGTPPELMRPRRPSTPIHVIKKQIFAATIGCVYGGIEPGTGKILKDGPYGVWADDSLSKENSITEQISKQGNDVEAEVPETSGLVAGTSRNSETTLTNYTNLGSTKRLSSDTPQSTKESLSRRGGASKSPEEDNRPAALDFNPAHYSTVCEGIQQNKPIQSTKLSSGTIMQMNETPKENVSSNIMESSSLQNSSKQVNEESAQNRSSTGRKVFLLSGLAVSVKEKYERIIRQLGAGVTQASTYDPCTTHIIIEKPIRSEKLLCCIASGKWVLHSSYLDYCYETREFLQEEEYEWGNPTSSSRLPKLQPGSTEEGLAKASYKWRQRKRDMGSAAPFRDMRVVLFTTDAKEPQFKRLLTAGSATILPRSDILEASHVVWEPEKVDLGVPLASLAARKIHIVPPVYLGEYLVSAPPPSQHYPQPYLRAIKERRAATAAHKK